MKRILSLIRRDMHSSVREFILVYGLLAPFLLALVIRAFIPSVGSASLNLVVTGDLGEEMIARLRDYGKVEIVKDRAALDRRVLALDDAAGIVRDGDGDGFVVVLEGNEAEETAVLPGIVLADILSDDPVAVLGEDLGRVSSPLQPVLATVLAMTAMLIGGMVIGFNIIEDKESGTLSALGVSPMSRAEYMAGRSLLGAGLALVLVFGSLYAMGAGPFNALQVLAVSVPGAVLAVLFGFYIGSVSESQVSGIATMKVGGLFFLLAPVLSAIVPAKWHIALYWLPTFWTYLGFREAFMAGGAAWGEILRLSAISLAVSLALLAVSWPLLRNKLVLRG